MGICVGERYGGAGMKEKKQINMKIILNLFSWLSLLLVIALFGVTTKGAIFSSYNMKVIFSQSVLFMIGGLGLSFLFAEGGFDISYGSVIGFAGILGTMLTDRTQNWIWSLIVPVVFCLTMGVVNGLIYAHTNIMVFIQTMSISFLLKGLFTTMLGSYGSYKVPKQLIFMGQTWFAVTALIVVGVITIWLFNYTPFGKHSRLYGTGKDAIVQSGVDVRRLKFLTFVFSGAVCALVTLMSMARAGQSSTGLGSNFEFNVMIALTLGGMPSEGGTGSKIQSVFIGCLIVALLANGMVLLGVNARLQEVIKGVIFILVLIFMLKIKEKSEAL